MAASIQPLQQHAPELVLPLVLFRRYLYFLARRPISESNLHYRATRVAGLQTLIPLLAKPAHPALAEAAEMLKTLTPGNLVRRAPVIQQALLAYQDPLLPRTLICSNGAPDASFFAPVRRVLVLIGPAIGIGDEIITFCIPRALRAILKAAPEEIRITVASSYPQVWDRVDGVDAVEPYSDMQGLLRCVRSGTFDLLMLADFETPGLTNAMCSEPAVDRYIELSLGPRLLHALDTTRQILWRMPVAEPNFDNFYDCMRQMMHWLSAPEDLSTESLMRPHEPVAKDAGELTIFVNPFTSKEDPSERYWSELMASMLPQELDRPVCLIVNTGPNLATRSLAFAMARRVQAIGKKNVRCLVPHHGDQAGTTLSIADIFLFSDRADIVVTADSFPAHAAQLFRKLTVVLGRAKTENWRSPSGGSFYFSSTQSLDEVSAGVRCLLRDALAPSEEDVRPTCVQELRESSGRLVEMIHSAPAPYDVEEQMRWRSAWESCRDIQSSLLAALPSLGYEVLFEDNAYADLLPRLPPTLNLEDPEVWQHLRRRLREWQNSNLHKYIQLASDTGATG